MAGARTYQYQGQTLSHYGLSQTVSLDGMDELRRLLRPIDDLVAQPWRHAMVALVELGRATGQAQAPISSGARRVSGRMRQPGRLRQNVRVGLSRNIFPGWAAVRSRGTTSSRNYKSYPYPRLLNYSQKHGHTGWFDRLIIEPVMSRAGAALDQALNEIERNWEA